jgi:hypothetical protein
MSATRPLSGFNADIRQCARTALRISNSDDALDETIATRITETENGIWTGYAIAQSKGSGHRASDRDMRARDDLMLILILSLVCAAVAAFRGRGLVAAIFAATAGFAAYKTLARP